MTASAHGSGEQEALDMEAAALNAAADLRRQTEPSRRVYRSRREQMSVP